MRRHKEVWKRFKLIFILIQPCEMHGIGRDKASGGMLWKDTSCIMSLQIDVIHFIDWKNRTVVYKGDIILKKQSEVATNCRDRTKPSFGTVVTQQTTTCLKSTIEALEREICSKLTIKTPTWLMSMTLFSCLYFQLIYC